MLHFCDLNFYDAAQFKFHYGEIIGLYQDNDTPVYRSDTVITTTTEFLKLGCQQEVTCYY